MILAHIPNDHSKVGLNEAKLCLASLLSTSIKGKNIVED